ncbi:T9SS type A sorting domain-containing protein [Flavobacterium pectinovorum]|uniref:T9SS C-terminal target domain-containing protein n=1 Tax=Flavobacterium pectinovorum TaxID=29533 RepID=A0A502F3N9_9FLAO|nr:T9SS type A sorting domain-containing protein [Flavobacterium pectinovorum]TPG44467.1 T9SS C-terminal target domain-containing protein [Flavobacterium pectinovorum]
MKTKLLLLLLLANFSIYAQNTVIPDINFENKLISLGIDSGVADGQVLTNNISGIKSVDVSNSSITNLTGIQDFIALTTLKCDDNPLTSVNISSNLALKDISFTNTKITSINLSANIDLERAIFIRTPLASIDISANINLTELNISPGGFTEGQDGPGNITNLDLSHNPNLKILNCSYHRIINLDLSLNPLLEVLNCGGNKETNLDLSKNTALTNLNLSNSFLPTIDLAANVNLTTLSIYDSHMVSIDLSKNTALQSLDARYAVYLKEINLKNGKNNLITSSKLYLTKTPGLYCVLVDDVAFSETNWASSKDSWLKYSVVCESPKYTLIPDVEFEKILILKGFDGPLDGKILTSAAAAITELDLKYSNYQAITDLTGIEDFAALELLTTPGKLGKLNVTKNIALKKLDCSNADLTTLDVSNNVNLITLDCSFNKLNLLDVSNNKLLNELNVGSNDLTNLNISQNKALIKLLAYDNQFTNLDFSNNLSLEIVNCGRNNLTTVDFSVNTELTEILCYENKLTNLDLTNNLALKSLNIYKSDLSTLDLSKNTLLKTLQVYDNLNLTELNLKNGNNNAITTAYLLNNTSLSCVLVDDVNYSNTNWKNKENWTTYSLTCVAPAYTLIPDIEFEKALISQKYDAVLDGKILTARAAEVKTLSLQNYAEITDLTGIEDFTSLESLSTYSSPGGKLKSLNLTKNISLKTLAANYTQITSLDLSKNIVLTSLNLSRNSSLSELNLKNQNNALLTNASINLTGNKILTCILVDDITFSNTNWADKKDLWATYSVVCGAPQYTLIPDIEFEKALISDGIDNIQDGKVLTARIAVEKKIDYRYTSYQAITDLTGIEDFTALEILNTPGNKIGKLNTTKNTALKTLNCSGENLSSLDLTNNKDLVSLNCSSNKFATIDVSANLALESLNLNSNVLTSLDIQTNTNLTSLNIGFNTSLKTVNLSKNTNLVTLSAFLTGLENLDVSTNQKLTSISCNSSKITRLDVSNNTALTTLNCQNNLLKSLNLQNGNNASFSTSLNFKNNPNLTCIQVDDIAYADANWASFKDSTAKYNLDCATYTLIPDSNFEDKLILLNIDKDGKNGKVKTESIASITSLNVSDSNISDLTGLQDFTNLTELNCSSNSLVALDINANKNLSLLNCSTNQLTALNLDNNTSLTDVNCAYNSITSLSVTKNPSLIKIDFSNNALNILNLKNGFNTNLDWFSVNFTKNPALSCIQVDNAQYSNDNWNGKLDKTSYFTEDCTAFTLIPDSNFEDKLIELKIDIDGKNGKVLTSTISKVTDLNVQLSEIKDLTGIEGFTALEYLNCQFNTLSSLDVSKNLKLIELYSHGNDLTTLNVSANTELTTLQCNKNQITNLDISKNTKLVYINASENNLKSLNLKNGNNTNFQGALLFKNPDLSCILVDNQAFANTSPSIFFKDEAANFNDVECILYTLIPDVNFENKLIALGIDSGTPDGKVATSKISALTELNLYGASISDLTGIQDFASLTSLNCMSNQLTTLDISQNLALTDLNAMYNKLTTLDTSKNIALENLSLSYNEITSLDLSKNANLSLLSCASNKLTNIDVSNNKTLSTLWCPSNELTTLDLSQNTSLISITCSENKLTNVNIRNGKNSSMQLAPYVIDFTKNPLLTCILVDDALYSNKNWGSFKDSSASYSTVDCSQIIAIPDPAFEDKLIALEIDKDGKNGSVLNSSIVNISSLNVSSSTIKDLTGIEGFTNLTVLDCSGNLISNLNLSQNKFLATLDCNNNKLLSLNVKNGDKTNFSSGSNFSNNTDLTCIQVEDADYATTNWTSIKDATANYNVDCNAYTSIPDSNFEDKLIALNIDKDGKNGKVLSANIKKVTYLDLSSSNISDMTGIEDFIALTELNCTSNTISNIDVTHNKSLITLTLHDNNLTTLDLTANTELFNVMFSKNQIETIDLSQNKKLHYLAADDNLLTAIDVSLNTELESFYCINNKITTIDVTNLPNLLDLSIGLNKISEINLSKNTKLAIFQCFLNNLSSLDLSQNVLLKRLNAANNQLISLDLSHNPLLELVYIVFNPLTTLNLQNGNNENFILPSSSGTDKKSAVDACSFLNNKNLSCIQVDNVEFSNAKWQNIKDATTNYSNTCKNLGIEDSVFDKVVVYPNPTKGEVTISNATLEKATVYNTLGQLVRSFTLDSANTNNTIDLSGLPRGVYYVYLINQDAASAKKVIVE